jgi:phosphoglycolate phosphatase
LYQVLERLQVEPENTLYVGDSDVDIVTARNAGARPISVTWGFRDEEFLKIQGAQTLIHRPMELLDYL